MSMITQTEAEAMHRVCTQQSEPPSNEILEALDLLHRTYPDERVDIWASWQGSDEGIRYTATVQAFTTPTGFECSISWPKTAMEAAQNLIERAGSRSRADRIAKRIAQLKEELATLAAEAEGKEAA